MKLGLHCCFAPLIETLGGLASSQAVTESYSKGIFCRAGQLRKYGPISAGCALT